MIKPTPNLETPAPTTERVPGSAHFERVRQRLLNNKNNKVFGNIDSGDLAHELKDISPEELTQLYIEFGRDPGMAELFQDATAKKQYYDQAGDYSPLSALNTLNSELSDFASQDRDENILMRGGRFLGGIAHGLTEGIQTGIGLGHDRVADTPINSGGALQQGGDLLGLANASLVKPMLKTGAKIASSQMPTITNALSKGVGGVKNMVRGGSKGIKDGTSAVGKDGVAKHTINGVDDVAKGAAKGADDVAKGAADDAAKGAKKGLIRGGINLAKKHPVIAGLGGLAAAAGIADVFDDADEQTPAQTEPTQKELDQVDGVNQSTLGLQTGLNAGEANAAGERNAANERGVMKPRLGGSGSKMADLGAARQRAFADKQEDIRQAKLEGTYDPTYSEDPNHFLKQRYESTGGRGAGDWDALTPEKKSEMVANYRANSYYDSSSDAGKAADAKLKESGWTAPMADLQSQAEGQGMAEQNRLQELDAAVERQEMGLNDAFGVAADPENYQGSVNAVSKDEFTDKSGMFTPGTGIIGDDDTGYTTLETAGAFKRSGGEKTAEEFLIGPEQQGPIQPQGSKSFGPQQNMPRPMSAPGVEQQGPVGPSNFGYSQVDPLLDPNVGDIQNQPRDRTPIENGATIMANIQNFGPGSGKEAGEGPASGKGMFTDQFGQQSKMSEGTMRNSANEQDYRDAKFTSNDDALGYVNRAGRPSMDEPAPAPGPVADPNAIMGPENTADTGLDTLTGLGLGAGVALLARKFGVPPAVAEKMYRAQQKVNVVPQQALPNATRLLRNNPQHRLGNMPARNTPAPGAQVTPEQFRRAASAPGAAQSPALARQHAAQNAPRVNLERSGIPRIGRGRFGETEKMRAEALRRQRQQAALGNTL